MTNPKVSLLGIKVFYGCKTQMPKAVCFSFLSNKRVNFIQIQTSLGQKRNMLNDQHK